ncbi:hypothetical protein CcCBS67573_g09556 [Chytriomyces confervae]|uniref:Protein phosphatase methylesterase 1 n=1 Tax=Chytriomyces confervae TaxID=246404 RepID=A0A507DTK0_9FUNG|nr:hypothetical protein CcCBS67573_g09556 [Chytriomyces confervae]
MNVSNAPTERTVLIGEDAFRVYDWTPAVAASTDTSNSASTPDTDASSNPATQTTPTKKPPPLFVLHHGAGSSALSFHLCAVRLADLLAQDQGLNRVGPTVVALDARGHGATVCKNEALELSHLSDDLIRVVEAVRRDADQEIVLVGHSMGGAVVVDACQKGAIKNIVGVGVIDVVEGTAIESLAHMNSILKAKPSKFRSVEDAIKWTLRSHLVQNKESAQISVPPLLVKKGEPPMYHWRTDLAASEPHWRGWFDGLSAKFLQLKCGRQLLLAGTDRLDKELMIGQMQGKFQVVVYPESWHYVQEDVPGKLALSLLEFWKRNQKLVIIKRFPIPAKPAVLPASTATV